MSSRGLEGEPEGAEAAAAGSKAGAGKGGGGGAAAGGGAEEITRIAALMKIDIGERGGEEERMHVERVGEMIAYFGMLDRAEGAAGGGGDGRDGRDRDKEKDGEEGWRGPNAPDIAMSELRADEPEDGGEEAGGAGAKRPPASSYARVQEEGGAYVRAPQMSP